MIEIRNVSKCFGETQAVSRVSLTLREANVFGMLGTNGAGKSTLLRMMAHGTSTLCAARTEPSTAA